MVRKRYSSGQDLKSAARDGESDGRRGVVSAAVVRSVAGVPADWSVSSVAVMGPRLGRASDSSECARRELRDPSSVPSSHVSEQQERPATHTPPGPEVLADVSLEPVVVAGDPAREPLPESIPETAVGPTAGEPTAGEPTAGQPTAGQPTAVGPT